MSGSATSVQILAVRPKLSAVNGAVLLDALAPDEALREWSAWWQSDRGSR